jgi:DhnA family fructose-bisphosphate aldolase class Ia
MKSVPPSIADLKKDKDYHLSADLTGLISGRKAFQRPLAEGVRLLNAIQDVYLSPEVTVA